MEKIILTADSTFDLTPAQAAALSIEVLPSYVRMGGDNLPDYPDIQMQTLFDYYEKSGSLPQTAAASPWDYTEFFRKYAGEGVQIVHLAKSAGASACCANAVMAGSELPGVHVFDTMFLAGGSALLAYEAARLRDEGRTCDELLEQLARCRDHIAGAFIVDQLEYLYKGGRCSALSAMGANLLRLRPEIVFKDGKMTVGKKHRGGYEKCMRELIDDQLRDAASLDGRCLILSHTVTDAALLARTLEYIRQKGIFDRIVALPAGAAVSCHCGPNTFGMFCMKK